MIIHLASPVGNPTSKRPETATAYTGERYGVLKEKQPTKESKYEKENNYYFNLDISISAIF